MGQQANPIPIVDEGLPRWKTSQTTVGVAAVQLAATPLSIRKGVSIKALSSNSGSIFIGPNNSVTTSTGYELDASEALDMDLDYHAEIWAIADAAAQVVCVAEIA